MAGQGLRTVGIAFKDLTEDEMEKLNELDENENPVLEKNELNLIGIFGICDPPRDEVPDTIQALKNAQIKVKMITGDIPTTALAIARRAGIADENSITMTGDKFRNEVGSSARLEGKNMKNDIVANFENFIRIIDHLDVLARIAPAEKYTLVTGLKQMGSTVAVVGDGANDEPAIKKANIGFAMGIAGNELAKSAADIILLDNNLGSILKAAKWGRSINDNVKKFIQFQLTVNLVAVTLAIVGAFTIKQSPLSATQLLW
eukprot:CAMPEP_0202940946 /NCGR_PEP_ID=MMETSP1395-20130829/1075_1 /ASSEMBLY_ACC=CAM_ASM_000871 /TAXON_ID=5961 /ORGANISM="Blepharisma japonicum, Strain Stock R1072" /LENGTH=258 /DNA_ID=CAMNT_0049635757 /DNA_START=1642 /DNA_END=2415 /DNA_ORIENTATION=+